MKRRPRQADVAALAGVSPAIVSLVINNRLDGNVRISTETQRRVWEAVRELGYVVNPIAQSLAGGQNRLLGVFTYESVFPVQQENFYYRFLVGIEEEAEAQGYDLVLFTRTSGENGRRRIYKEGVNRLRLGDGAVLLGTNEDRMELARLLEEGFPFVFVGRREVPGGEVSYVAADYVSATVAVLRHIVELGHRRIVYFRQPGSSESSVDREMGYRLGHQQLGLPFDDGSIQPAGEEILTPELVAGWLARGATAFICEHIRMARRLLDSAQVLGKRIPEDFSLAILGNPMQDAEAIPNLTTFLIPRREMGAQAVRLLVQMLSHPRDPGPYRVTLPCTFVAGRTVAAPPQRA